MAISGRPIKAGQAAVEISAHDNKLVRALDRAKARLKRFGASVTAIGTKLTAASGAMAAPFAASVGLFSNMGDAMDKMSKRTGMSSEALSELAYAANLSGTDAAALEQGLQRMNRAIVAGLNPSSAEAAALAELGLSAQQLLRMSPEDQFDALASGIDGIANPTRKAAMAMQLFGRSGTQLLPMMEGGAAAINQMRQEARDLGYSMSKEDVAAAAKLNDQLGRLYLSIKMVGFHIGAALAGPVGAFIDWFVKAAKSVMDWIKANRGLVAIIAGVVLGIGAAGVGLIAFGILAGIVGSAIGAIGTIIGTIATIGGAVFSVLAGAIAFLLSPIGLVVLAIVAVGAIFLWLSGLGGKILKWLGERWTAMKDTAVAAFGSIVQRIMAGDLQGAMNVITATMQLAWANLCYGMQWAWVKAKSFIVDVAFGMLYGVEVAWHGIKVGWIETVSALAKAWSWFTGLLQKGMAYVQSLWDSSFNLDKALAAIDEAAAAQQRALEKERKGEREQERRRSERRKDELGQGLLQVQRDLQKELDPYAKALEKARAGFKEAVEAPIPEKPEAEKAKPKASDYTKVQGQVKSAVESRGTFSAFQAMRMGGPIAIVDQLRAIKDNTKKMVDRLGEFEPGVEVG